MTHRNAPLSVEGRERLVRRCQARPIAHVAAEMGISRACASKWVNRHRQYGELGLQDRPSVPHGQPSATPPDVVARIEQLRRDRKWSARRIRVELGNEGVSISVRTVGRILGRLGLNRRKFLDPSGDDNRAPQKIVARWPGHMVHVDVKKVGRIPDGGGWRVHGRGSEQAKAANRAKTRGVRAGYVYLHSAVDGFSRLGYTEPLTDEKAKTAVGFLRRAMIFFAAHGITHVHRVVTDNGSCYRAAEFTGSLLSMHASRQQKIKPRRPQHNGKVERYQRTLAEELLYAREWTSEDERARAISIWNIHYNYHRPHTAIGDQPPASRLKTGVTNVLPSNT
jgi:transposase InsO family protein